MKIASLCMTSSSSAANLQKVRGLFMFYSRPSDATNQLSAAAMESWFWKTEEWCQKL